VDTDKVLSEMRPIIFDFKSKTKVAALMLLSLLFVNVTLPDTGYDTLETNLILYL